MGHPNIHKAVQWFILKNWYFEIIENSNNQKIDTTIDAKISELLKNSQDEVQQLPGPRPKMKRIGGFFGMSKIFFLKI